MRELFQAILILIGALLVSCLVWPLGVVYSLFYSIWLTVLLKKWYAFPLFWWRLIDGVCSCLGHIILNIGYALDLSWNVNGEIIEDIVTTEEHSMFSVKGVTVSASIGREETLKKITPWGKRISKFLSFAFNQKSHATDSWKYYLAKKKIESEYFKK